MASSLSDKATPNPSTTPTTNWTARARWDLHYKTLSCAATTRDSTLTDHHGRELPLSRVDGPTHVQDAQAAPTAPALVYDIKMTCGGCSGAINRVLTKNIQPRELTLLPLYYRWRRITC